MFISCAVRLLCVLDPENLQQCNLWSVTLFNGLVGHSACCSVHFHVYAVLQVSWFYIRTPSNWNINCGWSLEASGFSIQFCSTTWTGHYTKLLYAPFQKLAAIRCFLSLLHEGKMPETVSVRCVSLVCSVISTRLYVIFMLPNISGTYKIQKTMGSLQNRWFL